MLKTGGGEVLGGEEGEGEGLELEGRVENV